MQIGEVTRFFGLIGVVGLVKGPRCKLVSSHAVSSVDLPNITNACEDQLVLLAETWVSERAMPVFP